MLKNPSGGLKIENKEMIFLDSYPKGFAFSNPADSVSHLCCSKSPNDRRRGREDGNPEVVLPIKRFIWPRWCGRVLGVIGYTTGANA